VRDLVKITVYLDYLSPWCYIATVRLHKLKEEYGDKIAIAWKSFPLVPHYIPERRFSAHSVESWRRANEEAKEEGLRFNAWDASRNYPGSSTPPLVAAKCAELQGEEALKRFQLALLKAHFEEQRDVSQREVLIALAGEAGLDVEQFAVDYDSDRQKSVVMAEYEEARSKYRGYGVPTVVFNEGLPISSAVPISVYKQAIERLLKRA
jgi:predicted DsbA family dithiol-disulfide isomerase